MNRQTSSSAASAGKDTSASGDPQNVQQQPKLSQSDSSFKCISALDEEEEVWCTSAVGSIARLL